MALRPGRSGRGAGRCGAINVKVNMPYRPVKCKGYYNKINNAKISREAAIAKIKSTIRNLCAARCGHIAGSEKGVRRIREEGVGRGGSQCRGHAAKLFMQRAKESSEINEASRYQLGYPCRPPLPRPPLPGSDSSSLFSQYFVVFFWAFFSLVSVSSSCCCSSFFFFFGVQLVRHERADSPSKDINSYGCRKGAEQEGSGERGAARPFAGCRQSRARVGRASSCGKWHVASR